MCDRYKQKFIIKNTYGLHIRPSTSFSKTAQQYPCEVLVCCKGRTVDGKKIMGLLSLEAACNDEITITATGEGAQMLLCELGKLIDNCFGIEEERKTCATQQTQVAT